MWGFAIVFLGGGLGAALRHGVNRASFAYLGADYPYGTLFVNVAGSLLMGMLAQFFLIKGGTGADLRLFLTTGVLGGFTTFSAFSLEAALMLQRGAYSALGLYIGTSVALSIFALFAGMSATRVVV